MSGWLNLVVDLSDVEQGLAEHKMKNVSPDDGKYSQKALEPYLSQEAE